MIVTLLFLFSFASAQPASQCVQSNTEKINSTRLWESDEWLGLLHFREGIFHRSSEADGKTFFISTQGKNNAEAEMRATVEALCENQTLKTEAEAVPEMQARCLFPAREQFFKAQGLSGWKEPLCPVLEDWKRKIGNEKVYLVFSSYYANNPSSVFGHTLLRIDRVQQSSGTMFNPLLSYGINFAGESNTANPALYALYGMIGKFRGLYTSLPYYYKVREYSDFDSRDLWEYELNMTDSQKAMLINHIWEQGYSHFDYFYFTENCSYHLLTSLDVALPELELDKKVPYWVIPVDTVKAVTTTEGLVSKVNFRPSLYRQFSERLRRLEDQSLDGYFYQFLKTGVSALEGLNEQHRASVFDTVLDYWDFKYTSELFDPNSDPSKTKMEYLKARANLPMTPKLEFPAKDLEQPDIAHETLRMGFGAGNDVRLGPSADLDIRFSLHDFLDNQKGYPKNAKIEFMKFNFSYFTDRSQFKINHVRFFDVQLITPWKKIENSFSWRSIVSLDRDYIDCDYCLGAKALFQGGAAIGFFENTWVNYALFGGDLRFSPQYQKSNLMALPMATLGSKLDLPSDLGVLLEVDYFIRSIYALKNTHRVTAETRKNFGLNHSIGVSYSKEAFEGFSNEKSAANFYYFF